MINANLNLLKLRNSLKKYVTKYCSLFITHKKN